MCVFDFMVRVLVCFFVMPEVEERDKKEERRVWESVIYIRRISSNMLL